jgi:hypothetical protein
MAWTTPRTWVANETVTSGIMNTHVRDNFNARHDGFFARGAVAGQSVASGSWVKLQLAETADPQNWWSTSYVFTPTMSGTYEFLLDVYVAAGPTQIFISLYKNGVFAAGDYREPPAVSDWAATLCSSLEMNGSTDTAEFYLQHNTGSNRNVNAAMTAKRLGTA